MKRVPVDRSNDFSPQSLFLYGTYKEDGTPNFGLFCWLTYCWDGELCIIASIGGEKLTKERIKATGVFSANLVNAELLPLADYFGNKDGHDADKMSVDVAVERGLKLDVPLLSMSPRSYELRVKRTIPLDGGELFICHIENILADERLADRQTDIDERMKIAAPAVTTAMTYFTVGNKLGSWGDWKEK